MIVFALPNDLFDLAVLVNILSFLFFLKKFNSEYSFKESSRFLTSSFSFPSQPATFLMSYPYPVQEKADQPYRTFPLIRHLPLYHQDTTGEWCQRDKKVWIAWVM